MPLGAPTTIRLPEHVQARVAERATQEGRSFSAMIVRILEEALTATNGAAPGPPPLVSAVASDPLAGRRVPVPARPTRPTKPSSRPCPHGQPEGSFCKRCDRGEP